MHRYLRSHGYFENERLYLADDTLSGYRYALKRFIYPQGTPPTPTNMESSDV